MDARKEREGSLWYNEGNASFKKINNMRLCDDIKNMKIRSCKDSQGGEGTDGTKNNNCEAENNGRQHVWMGQVEDGKES